MSHFIRFLSFSLCILILTDVQAQVFVAPDGSDTNAGTMEEPLATLQQAQDMVSPGDTVYIRGGTYHVTEDQISRVVNNLFASIAYLDKSGTEGNTIKYWAYPGETPVFDYSEVKPPNQRVVGIYVAGSYLHIKGLEMTGIQTTITGHTESYCIYSRGSNNIFEQLVMHNNVGTAFRHYGGGGNLVLNSDAYNNWDNVSEQGIGDNNDGFGMHPREGSEVNIIRGSRAWFNSDDGFDIIRADGPVLIDSSWAFYNGFSSTFRSLGDGTGFKVGGFAYDAEDRLPAEIPRHTVQHSLAVRNKANGFYANHHLGGNNWYNNTGYRNGNRDFNMLNRPSRENAENIDGPGYDHVLINNVAYADFGSGVSNIVDSLNTIEANNWTLGISVSSDDFLSVDLEQLTAPRKPDGSLPDIDFLRPTSGSMLIDAGVDIGFPFLGEAPDLGAFESAAPTNTQSFPENPNGHASATLFPNYPNPFGTETTIRYELSETAQVTLTVYNVLGKKVKTLISQQQSAGKFDLLWRGENEQSMKVPPGVYFYQLILSKPDEIQSFRKMMLRL